MGASQSAGSYDGNESARTCYYEVLGVDEQANDLDIKRAYRRRALELHPDRNPDNVSDATRKFAELQTAYEILIDPHERSWYDSHKDDVLSGNSSTEVDATHFHNIRQTSTEDILSLVRRFSTAMPFDDEQSGFYGIARETFERLAVEEEAAAAFSDCNCVEYPGFGLSTDTYEPVVRHFYKAWTAFATLKTFSWKDKHRLSEAPDRRTRRVMEKENKQLRDAAVRDFNNAVRFLVSFVRKRDPRHPNQMLSDAARQRSLLDASAAQAARSRAANASKHFVSGLAQWAQSKPEENHDSDGSGGSEPEEQKIFECVVCDKFFKSEKQIEVHEQSKKHTRTLQTLRKDLRLEEDNLDRDRSPASIVSSEVMDTVDVEGRNPPEPLHAGTEQQHMIHSSHGKQTLQSAGPLSLQGNMDERDIQEQGDSKEEAGDYVPHKKVASRLVDRETRQRKGDHVIEGLNEEGLAPIMDKLSLEDAGLPGKRLGKAKVKRRKKAAERTAHANDNRCASCATLFSSRTKLFDHIRREGHAAPRR